MLAGLLLANMIPVGPPGHLALAQTADSSIVFAENGEGPVGTFRAHDQDGDSITWSLGGPDADLFSIDEGVLSFREPPDYEDPRSAGAGGPTAGRNAYRVTVRAGGGTHDVTVTVTDVDEAGAVSISRLQPQVSRPLSASLLDVDDGVTGERWQWARSADRATWTHIAGASSPNRSPAEADEGTYLRATVTYSDKFGAGKNASAVSANRVETRTLSNAAPRFVDRDGDDVTTLTRDVRENTAVGRNVGRRVSAADADEDILFYELLDTPDLEDDDGVARFTIDSSSGQIRVGKLLGADAGEREDEATSLPGLLPALPENENAGEANNSEYVLRVRVSDPSTASAAVNVIASVTNVNEAPAFDENVPTLLRIKENADPLAITFGDDDSQVNAATFAVTDQDDADTTTTFRYSVTGDDREVLEFDSSNILGFTSDHEPDFEEKRSYSISVVARFGGRSATLGVTVEVVDGEDKGEVSLSQRQPRVGISIHATPSDPDGGVRINEWLWERSDEIGEDADGNRLAECRQDPDMPEIVVVDEEDWDPIVGATTATYTPEAPDVGRCLRATAVYTDDIGDAQEQATGALERPVQDSSPANAAPEFVDQDLNTAGDQSDRTSRKVAENTEAGESIGSPVSAFDDDRELLIYALGGEDADLFTISRDDGQLKTMASLNFEARNRYAVVVTATDPSGAADSIQVTINVTDVHDPVRITGVSSVRYAENGSEPVASFTAFDEAGHVITWSVGGDDDHLFTIEDGVLAFRQPPNYENPQSASESNVYRVTVEAAGGTRRVTVTVTDADDAGTASIDRPQPQVSRPLSASLSDEDDMVGDERWQWARSRDGRSWRDIEGAISPLRSPTLADVGMYLRATVTYSDKFGDGRTVSAVSANRVEATTLANNAPSFAGQDDDETTSYIDIARSVAENTAVGMPIGEPVSATDEDEDILLYELLDTPDLEDDAEDARFTIDSLTGQIRIGKLLGADPGETEDEDSTGLSGVPELPEDEDADNAGNSEYILRVRVTDPSTASATVNVIVRVTEVNEPPAFGDDVPTLLSVVEKADPLDPLVIRIGHSDDPIESDTYAVTEQDGDDTCCTYSVSGADGEDFDFSGGTLTFKPGHEPDFEDQSLYSITIEAQSGDGDRSLTSALDVTIEVVDGEDPGAVVLSQRQPEVGIVIHATASDDDDGVAVRRWVWELYDGFTVTERAIPFFECIDFVDENDWTMIAGATSAVYAPKVADVGKCLRATAFYIDNVGRAQEQATGVLEVPVGRHGSFETALASDSGFVNAAPVFPDQNYSTEGDQSDTAGREVAENTKAGRSIGEAVSARDDDDDLLIYTLDGQDAASFDISRATGQLMTKAALDYEARDSYSVVVTVTDPFGATDSIVVTINVTDEDDPAVIRVLSR